MTQQVQAIAEGVTALGITADNESIERLDRFLTELDRWNARYGFIKALPDEYVPRHLLDALSGLALLRQYAPAGTILDLGSGAGFPGLPLAVLMPDRRLVLCERKATERAFLSNMALFLKLKNVVVEQDIRTQTPGSLAAVVNRAVASLKEIHAIVHPYLAPDGILFAYKGTREKIDAEIDEIVPLALKAAVLPVTVPGVAGERHIVIVRG
jgi:16S rRNA (guanine527-N7)-methyltransferase